MNVNNKTICIQTVLTLVVIATGVAIGYTNFVQAEIKEDVGEVKIDQDINTEKINSLQVQLVEIRGDVKLLLERTAP